MGKIMFIDDDAMVLRMAGFIMKKSGDQILTADCGKQGIADARKEQPDIIFVDAEMPETDGFEVIRRLKADSVTAGIPVYMMSGTVTDEIIAEAKELGVADIVEKPLNAAMILDIIKNTGGN